MNKKANLVILIALIIASVYLYFSYVKDNASVSMPSPSPSSEAIENISVELTLKTPASATDSAMTINLPSGSDHCAVLTRALADGKINELDMRFNEEFKTNSVFIINGIGKTDSPWWVYKINGTDAPAGCTQVKVAPGDKILWEYLGT